jgi:hypothetical protein
MVASLCPRGQIRARHLVSTSLSPHSRSSFRLCSVDNGTLKMEPCHIYHDMADMVCWRHSIEGCSTCTFYHNFAYIYTRTYVIRCAMLRTLPNACPACVRTKAINTVQRASADFVVFLILTPRIVISSLYVMPIISHEVSQVPTAKARDFCKIQNDTA